MTRDKRLEVAVLPPIPDRAVLSYSIPPSLSGSIREGMRVLVPLGSRQVTGIVVGIGENDGSRSLKDALDLLDDDPLLTSDLLDLCRFASNYYMVSLSEVLVTAVLAGLRAQSRRTVRRLVDRAAAERAPGLGPAEKAVLDRIPEDRPIRTTALSRALRSGRLYEAIRSLAKRGLVAVEEEAPRAAARLLTQRVFRAAREVATEEAEQLARRAPAQWALLNRIREAGPPGATSEALGGARSAAALRALASRGFVRIDRREVYRRVAVAEARPGPPVSLTSAQRDAIEAITARSSSGRFEVFLLRGVTGSGKTEVYLHAAADVLSSGRGVLFLVPEIALTHELVAQVCSRFGSSVALLHSALSPGERWDEWRRLSRREARIAIGVRSAVFAPVPDLGLVIVDEEHDGAYKQEDGLRYNARDLAVVRARNAACPVVLGSATPSIESHHNTRIGRYRLLELPDRVEQRPLPIVELIDLRTEHPEGDPPVFAPRLRTALAETLAAGGQSLIFLNRRGYAHYLQCALCGAVLGCPHCSVTLTFHRQVHLVRCHHCDYTIRAPDLCPECTSPELRDFGIGTEQVEAVLQEIFPSARIARMDRDTMARKGAQREVLAAWRRGVIDILIGTQMVTKGHDVPGVTFVGVVAADQTLNFPDFRAPERTFQILTQVAGRAGRGSQPGRVMIQTYRPTHYALQFSITHDFLGFAEHELRAREALSYPPFSRLVNLRLDGPKADRVEAIAREITNGLRAASAGLPRRNQAIILGPAPAPLERLRGRYRWQILLKGRDPRSLQSLVRPACEAMRRRARASAVRIAIDVDPYGML